MSYLPDYVRELTIPPIPAFDVWHPQVVHFPVALLFVAPLFVLLGLFLGRARRCLFWSALILMTAGTLSAWLAVKSGEAAAGLVKYPPYAVNEVLEQHEEMAKGSLNVFIGLTGLLAVLMLGSWAWRKIRPENPAPASPEAPPAPKTCCCRRGPVWVWAIYLVLYAGGLFLLTNAAHRGGTLVHQYGVRAPFADPKLTFTAPATTAPATSPAEP